MFQRIGNLVSRAWPAVLAAWVLVLVVLAASARKWEDVVQDGEFRYLPDNVPSRQAEELFKKSFSNDLLGSTIVIVVRRESREEGLYEEDFQFIDGVLKPQLEKIAGIIPKSDDEAANGQESADSKQPADNQSAGSPTEKPHGNAAETTAGKKNAQESTVASGDKPSAEEKGNTPQVPPDGEQIVSQVRTFSDKAFGKLLTSEDNQASLVIVELTTEFMELRNQPVISAIEKLLHDLTTGPRGEIGTDAGKEGTVSAMPAGLDLKLSGTATVGRDMREAARDSAKATENMTVILVVILLLLIYRAPMLALIPLMTVFVAVSIAIRSLSVLADLGFLQLFNGIEVYVTVVLYGAGVDFCIFLMARYKEELDAGATFDEAISTAVGKVGHAVTASAGTVMFGIGMMIFAQFGKFQQAGIAMSLSLMVVLLAALTFAPAMLCLAGRWAFWPRMPSERIASTQGWISPTSMMARLMETEWFSSAWRKIGDAILARPGKIWLACFGLMLPFALVSLKYQNHLSYGLLSELPDNQPSVTGADAIQKHFPAGITGPLTVLLKNDKVDFHEVDAWEQLRIMAEGLYSDKEVLDIADIRFVAEPLGLNPTIQEGLNVIARGVAKRKSQSHYVSDQGDFTGHVTRMDVIFRDDPFSRNSMERFDTFHDAIRSKLPAELKDCELYFLGSTASIRDLKTITSADQVTIDILVPGVVFLILVLLLRKVATSAYLIFTVFFGYLVTLGLAFVLFGAVEFFSTHDLTAFAGLDWKVRMFLFTILIAVGQDYNIFLITRIEEEQKIHGPVQGVIEALLKTGSIISSCGIIMAGTFSSLMFGSLAGMQQLGFALAFGVLLDTFVVRPIFVPCYLILLHRGKFGGFGKYLGAQRTEAPVRELSHRD